MISLQEKGQDKIRDLLISRQTRIRLSHRNLRIICVAYISARNIRYIANIKAGVISLFPSFYV